MLGKWSHAGDLLYLTTLLPKSPQTLTVVRPCKSRLSLCFRSDIRCITATFPFLSCFEKQLLTASTAASIILPLAPPKLKLTFSGKSKKTNAA